MEVKPGYRQSEVGVIPEEWDVIELRTVTTQIGDGLHGTPVYSLNGSYFFINGELLSPMKPNLSKSQSL
jgi:type I restriction enzyme, S subunit